MDKIRVDKWLWSVRIFKTRTTATDACKAGKIKVNDKNAKPSTTVGPGDKVDVSKNGFDFKFLVVSLLKSRVSATLAAPCYQDLTPPDELMKYKNWFTGKARVEFRDRGAGRPTKKERREIDDFKEDFFDWDSMDD